MKILVTTSDRLDDVLRWAPSGAVIELADGVHTTQGAWIAPNGIYYDQVGVTLQAAADAKPVVRLVDPVSPQLRPDNDYNLPWFGSGWTFRGITWDANYVGNGDRCVGGIRCHGPATFEACAFVGLRGRADAPGRSGVEVWPIAFSGDSSGSRIDRCTLSDCAPGSYVSGFFVGAHVPSSRQSLIIGCDVQLDGGWFGFSANYGTTIVACRASGVEAFFHNDTGDTVDVRLIDCHGTAAWAALRLTQTVPGQRHELAVETCDLSAPRLIEMWDRTPDGTGRGRAVIIGTQFAGEYSAAIAGRDNEVAIVACGLPPGHKFAITGAPLPMVFNPRS